MTFQITDIPRLLPELMLLALALLVLGTDVLERWGTDAQSHWSAAGGCHACNRPGLCYSSRCAEQIMFTVTERLPKQPVCSTDHDRTQFAGRGAGGDPILGAFAPRH